VQLPGRPADTSPSTCADVATSTTVPETPTSAASPVTTVNEGIVSGPGPTGGTGIASSPEPQGPTGSSGSDGGVAGTSTTVPGG
jgi:hypothetical protein